jgi:3',5'-cyclic AMP phosphodiesterase CpdA
MSDDHDDHHHDHDDPDLIERLLKSDGFKKTRRDMHEKLIAPGQKPTGNVTISRRIFVHKALLGGAVATAATVGWLPRINMFDMAYAQDGGKTENFRFAWVSDTHLLPKEVNTRFVDKTTRAVKEVAAMNPAPDFMIFGGDLAQLGDPVELKLGNEILKEIKVKKYFIPGEHDWYLDMGKLWNTMFGTTPWTFDHKGVRFIGLDTISRAIDFWTVRKMTPEERMGAMATLDGGLGGAWAGVGVEQLDFMTKTLSNWPKDKPVIIISHNPLYEYYPPWNFWVRDWQMVHEVLKPYTNVTNIHGHCHQVLYNEIGGMRSIGMLATSWPWPYAPEGVPALTKPMKRVDPGNPFDGVGWGKLTFASNTNKVENEYMMWRKDVFASKPDDSGTADNASQVTWPRPEGR